MLEGHGEMRIVVKTGAEDLIFGSGGGGVVSGGNPRACQWEEQATCSQVASADYLDSA